MYRIGNRFYWDKPNGSILSERFSVKRSGALGSSRGASINWYGTRGEKSRRSSGKVSGVLDKLIWSVEIVIYIGKFLWIFFIMKNRKIESIRTVFELTQRFEILGNLMLQFEILMNFWMRWMNAYMIKTGKDSFHK